MGDNSSWLDYIGKDKSTLYFYYRVSGLFFNVFTVINIIVLLNLLIAVISDAYDNIQENEIPNDAIERCAMMREVEYQRFWNKNKKDMKYVHLIIQSDCLKELIEGNEWEGKVRAIKQSILSVMHRFEENEKQAKQNQQDLKDHLNET